MTDDGITFRPTLTFLSEQDRDKIHQAVLKILSEIGMQILHDEALGLLAAAGCQVENDRIVKISGALVDRAMDSAPNNIAIYDRLGRHVMDLGGRRAYFGTGSDLIYSDDSQTKKRHPCVLEDIGRAARAVDALPNIDFVMSFAYASDFPAEQAFLRSFQTMAANSTKPIVCTAQDRDDLSRIWELASILRGGEDALRQKPYFLTLADPISPLKHNVESLDKLLFCAERSVPLIYSPAPIAGSTGPITIAGQLAQGLAECFCGLVIHQLKAAGAPFIMGVGPAVLDMATGQCCYDAPEYLLAFQAAVEMSLYYDLPNWGYAGTTDSQIPDGQAAFEGGLETFIAALAGSNLNHDVGYMDFGRTGSLEMVVIMDEVISQVRRMNRPIPVDEETLAVDVIREVGFQDNFLTHPHTLRHLRTTQWRPKLLNRKGYEKWEAAGSTSLLERARKRLDQILEEHQPQPIPPEQALKIQTLVDQFKRSGE
jgi:trimethylamine---corrinoid protein Co-methyltransferase